MQNFERIGTNSMKCFACNSWIHKQVFLNITFTTTLDLYLYYIDIRLRSISTE